MRRRRGNCLLWLSAVFAHSLCGPQGERLFAMTCFITRTRARTHTYTFLAQSRQSHNTYFLGVALVRKIFFFPFYVCVCVCVYACLRECVCVCVPGSGGMDQ